MSTSLNNKIKYLFLLIILLFVADAHATHYRAGEITYKRLSGRLYEVTVHTYTDPNSDANPNTQSLEINWGDSKTQQIQRTQLNPINGTIQRNVYVATHDYQTDGTFRVSITDPNRVDNILNINRGFTEQLPFYVEAVIFINSSIQSNNSPTLLNPPIDDGCIGFLYVHNPGAFDSDGDSLIYRIIPPKIAAGQDVPLYVEPFNSDSFALDPIKGTVYWANPTTAGYYNIAIQIIELRNGFPVGSVTRDMQIRILDCPNTPPTISPMPNACVKVGNNYTKTISASDINSSQVITLIPVGGPFIQTPGRATQTPDTGIGSGTVNVQFNWRPECFNIRNQSYFIQFKVSDNFAPRGTFTDGFFLKVNGPEPKNVEVKQVQRNALRIAWSPDECGLATKYKVYKRVDSSFWSPGPCETDVPASTGFVLLKEIDILANPNDTFVLDNNGAKGLSPLVNYCYRIISVFPARSALGQVIGGRVDPSYASTEVCGSLIRSKPIITKVSVDKTSETNGLMSVSYLKPDTLDTLFYKSPYRITLKRKLPNDASYTQLSSYIFNSFEEIVDSFWLDSNINTADLQYSYQIDFYSDINTAEKFIDESNAASSIKLDIYSSDRKNILTWNAEVPWENDSFYILRKNAFLGFDTIGVSVNLMFTDTGLTNDETYCYKVLSVGSYSLLPLRIINYSQEICGTPVDTIAPCAPLLTVTTPCNSFNDFANKLKWVQNVSCALDVLSYRIYFKKDKESDYILIATVPASVTSYEDNREELKFSVAGCYAVNSVDTNGNEGSFQNEFCVDNCPYYVLPNIFTPNNDKTNDFFIPFEYRFIDKIDMKIYNRWGGLVFKTENPDVLWDGTEMASGNTVSNGVYYFVCDVYERYLDGVRKRKINGTVQIIR